ncbi:hypothetical protein C0991_005200 [Blastosporella zonata]|nr:hypothetical protein C0991_005200 [Blastosporella zonata]
MAAIDHDVASEQLITQLLQEDRILLESYRQAEIIHLDQFIAISEGEFLKPPNYLDNDADLAFELFLSDTAYAQTFQNEAFAENTADLQLAQRLTANERKIDMDAEFARRLQAMQYEGRNDIDDVKDAESIPGDHVVAMDPNALNNDEKEDVKPYQRIQMEDEHDNVATTSKGKGKGRQMSDPALLPDDRKRTKYEFDDRFSVMAEEQDDIIFSPTSRRPLRQLVHQAQIRPVPSMPKESRVLYLMPYVVHSEQARSRRARRGEVKRTCVSD